jgi:FAD/FMN-containing dehydrogenase
LTLGGGSGWLERKFGLACDNLLSVEVVTADGRLLTASDSDNPELFWALHGGGGNFGIATSFTFRLHPLPAITAALLLWPAAAGREVAARYRDFTDDAPDGVGGGLLYVTGPPEEFVPEHLVGVLTCLVLVTFTGEEAGTRDLIEPLLELSPHGQLVMEFPYAELQCTLDDPPGFRNYWSAEYLQQLPDQALDRLCARAEEMVQPSPSQLALIPWGGEVARNPEGSALANRDASWVVHPFGLWEDPDDDDRAKQWARNVCADLKPFATGGVYLNFIGDEGEDRVIAGYGRSNYQRLAAVKAEYDPDNVFKYNHNVRPRPAQRSANA